MLLIYLLCELLNKEASEFEGLNDAEEDTGRRGTSSGVDLVFLNPCFSLYN